MKFLNSRRKVNAILMILSGLGALISLYLWDATINQSEIICFTGCEKVLASDYGKLFGVPVAAFGFGFYSLLALLFYFRSHISHYVLERVVSVILVGGVIFTLYLRYVEFFLIGDICMWCWGSVVVLSALVALYGLHYYKTSVK